MRTFIAIDLPQNVKDHLSGIQEQLKNIPADIKWVTPKNIHLTLKFLGEIDQRKADKICSILDNICKDKSTFVISLSSLGVFPDMHHPRVVWIGLDKGEKELQRLAMDIEDGLNKIHIRKEKRPFSSHITLGRIKSGRIDNLPDKLADVIPEFAADRITFFKSTLTSGGPVYEVIKEAILKAA